MSEQRLRDLLRQAVPEAPDPDPAAIGRRAVRERRNRASVAAGGAAALAIVVGTLALAGLTGDDGTRPSPNDVATRPSANDKPDGPLSPYDPRPCPARLPDPETANRAVTDLDGVVAVRLCPDLNPRGETAWQPTPDDLAQLEDADALVRGLAGFAADLRGLPTGLPAYCATDEGPYIGQAFAFYRSDGTRVLVAAPGCQLVTVEGRRIDSEAVRQLYLAALDRQRDSLSYDRPFDDELACTSEERGDTVRPGRERLVAAVACELPPGAESVPMDLEPIRLDATQLAELDDAWARPGDPIIRGASGENECIDLKEPPSYILAATDRSDVVQLIDSPCGFLVWNGWENSQGATIPTTLGELGVR
ncbi:hypothetical protein GCM10027062_43310 [Nocardioides hungaricus]